MVEPAGAMAMFVLRLAGLLSLENALNNQEANLTHPAFNLTSLGIDQSFSNLTWPPDPEPHVVGSVSQSSQEEEEEEEERSSPRPPAASWSDLITPCVTDDSAPPLSPPTTEDSSANTIPLSKIDESLIPLPTVVPSGNDDSTSDKETSPSQSKERGLGERDVTDSIEMLPTPSHLSAPRNTAGGNVHRPKSGRRIKAPQARQRKGDAQSRQHQMSVRVAQATLGGDTATDTVHSHRGSEHTTTTAGPHREPEVSSSPSEAEGTRHAGDRREESGVSSGLGRSEPPPRDLRTRKGADHATSSLPEATTTTTTTLPPGRSRPRLEGLVEEDDLIDGLIDGQKHGGLEAPSEDYVDRDFEYYDFGSHQHVVTPKPTLPSLSLVSPVPVRVPPRSFEPVRAPPRPPERRTDQSTRKPAPARPRKRPAARPIPRSNPQRPLVRNNPYPYGPKRLPGPYAPLTPNLPTVRENNQEQALPEYNYEDDSDYYYGSEEEEDSRFEVQTKEPPVLFVFDKPGYYPEAPTTVVPPTRSPTPSDPWDCAPRCPRYTLLDWNMDYDVRQYPDTLWVSTVIISDNRVLAELEGYMRVQDYFYGLNDQGLVLNLTVPFVTQVKFGKHPGVLQETNDYTVSLYVQPTYYRQGELPTPISNEVLVDELEAKTVFVHSFEANVWDVTETFLEEKVTALMQQLRHNGEAFLDRYYYLASYSRPELYQTVYYEVWVYATNFRDPQTSTKTSTPYRRPQTNKITQKTLSKLCRGVECPKFEVLRTYKYGIQKRRYYDGLFASSSPKECQFTTMSVWKGFMPLHLYKHGINSHMEVIEATRPIALVHVKDSTSPLTECPQNLTMSLYLPHRLHSNPPITGYAAPNVHITALDDVIVYAYTVGGYLLDPTRVRRELSDMKYRLSEFGACYKDDEHFVVIYDFIVRYHGRQNEIWIVAENCKATHNG